MTAAPGAPWRTGAGCVIVRLRITPKSSKDAIDGVEETAEGPALRARVRAIPAEGEANKALERLVAQWLDVPKSSVALSRGGKSRVKSLEITGDTAILEARLAERVRSLATPTTRQEENGP